jgi:pyruvate formate lyase activating enzyme
MSSEARWWEKKNENAVQCGLCPQNCVIKNGKTGLCGVRKNSGGKLSTTIYGQYTGANVDPIEKKPLYHFYPGRPILSLGAKGCNMACAFCQNWHISQNPEATTQTLSPEEAVSLAMSEGSFGIAYTYSEPMIWFEYVIDTAAIAHEQGLKNVMVTNGFINLEPLKELLPFIDAMNIDMKSFDPIFYRKICQGSLDPVKKVCEESVKECHVEITNLVVPFKEEEKIIKDIEEMVEWIAGSLGENVPLHFSRYFPSYHYEKPQTSADLMNKAYEIACKKLNYVYLGNIHTSDGGNTLCPKCSAVLIKRFGYQTSLLNLSGGKCTKCGRKADIEGV